MILSHVYYDTHDDSLLELPSRLYDDLLFDDLSPCSCDDTFTDAAYIVGESVLLVLSQLYLNVTSLRVHSFRPYGQFPSRGFCASQYLL